MKHLRNKQQILEFFNPVLDGSYLQSPSNSTTSSDNPIYTASLQGGSMLDVPYWLSDEQDEVTVRNGDKMSLATIYLNGIPISPWSAMQGGNMVGYDKRQAMSNWYHIDNITKQLFPNGMAAYMNQVELETSEISNLSIIRLVPCNSGIGFNIYVKFDLGENKDIFGKFFNVGVDINPKFQCQDLDKLKTELKIKLRGKIWNTILDWFKVKSGIFKCIAKSVIIYSELGQLKQLVEEDIIEVINSDEKKIKIRYNDTFYFIKQPNYYWFNWYFEKH